MNLSFNFYNYLWDFNNALVVFFLQIMLIYDFYFTLSSYGSLQLKTKVFKYRLYALQNNAESAKDVMVRVTLYWV